MFAPNQPEPNKFYFIIKTLPETFLRMINTFFLVKIK
jgi:hypothetical protein